MQGSLCGPFPTCTPSGLTCFSNSECCSFRCGGDGRCEKGEQLCLSNSDCLSGCCNGFACPELWQPLLESLECGLTCL
jgi:hypothetical protein